MIKRVKKFPNNRGYVKSASNGLKRPATKATGSSCRKEVKDKVRIDIATPSGRQRTTEACEAVLRPQRPAEAVPRFPRGLNHRKPVEAGQGACTTLPSTKNRVRTCSSI